MDPRELPAQRRLRGPAQGVRHDPRRGHLRGQGLRPARPRRRRLPDRHEVGLHPAGRRQAALPRGQRRRVRARHLQGHAAAHGQPAHPDRGRHHRLLRDPRLARLHLHPRRGRPHRAPAAAGGAGGLRRRLPRHRHHRLRLQPRGHGPRRRRRLHLRRGDGAARLARGLPRPAPAAPAVPRRRRALRQPDRASTTSRPSPVGPVDPDQRRGLVRLDGHREVQGLRAVQPLRPRHQARPVRGAARHHPARADRPRRRHPRGPRAEVLDARRLLHADPHRRAPRRAARLRGRRRGRVDARHPRAADLRRDHLRRARRAALDRVLRPRVLRQVHPVPRGHVLDGADPAPARARRRHPGRPRPPGRHLRQHPRPVVLRPGRRRHQPDHLVHPVLQGRVPQPRRRTAAARSTRWPPPSSREPLPDDVSQPTPVRAPTSRRSTWSA